MNSIFKILFSIIFICSLHIIAEIMMDETPNKKVVVINLIVSLVAGTFVLSI